LQEFAELFGRAVLRDQAHVGEAFAQVGFASAAPISAFSFCTIARGVPAGANTPPNSRNRSRAPASVAVGVSEMMGYAEAW